MFRFATRLGREVVDLFHYFLPPACGLCLDRLDPPDPDQFCAACTGQIPVLKHNRCPRCALPYPDNEGSGHLCKTCLAEKKSSFTGVTAVGSYDGLLREAIHRFKYRGDINLDRPLARLLEKELTVAGVNPDLIVPVPMHPLKTRQRGYNQATLLAARIARQLHIPSAPDRLMRTSPGLPQQTLAAIERTRNIRGAFSAPQQFTGESILLVDDVMTTGATARECARTLLRSGATSIHVAVLARAPLK